MVSNNLIGCLPCGKAGFLLDFDTGITLASLRVFGKM
jgi:hypothetical protein